MNRFTVRLAARGLGSHIGTHGEAARQAGVVIGYDTRHHSADFAREAALTLAAAGVVAWLWPEPVPTPLLSFGVRYLAATAGIMITASHNPPEYNGLKVYWSDGGQTATQRAAAIAASMAAAGDVRQIQPMAEREARDGGWLKPVPPEVARAYQAQLRSLITTRPEERANLRLLFSPLYGTTGDAALEALSGAGYPVRLVSAQSSPDPDFGGLATPNPEDPAIYRQALAEAAALGPAGQPAGRQAPGQPAGEQPDLILATDPDGSRLGVMAWTPEGYRLLTGNQIGALLTEYILQGLLERRGLPQDGVVIKSVASTNLVRQLCRAYGVRLMETPVGFKYIAARMAEFDQTGRGTFLFGFDERHGYLGATFVRDKDGVMAALLVAEAAAYHKARGRTLPAALRQLWRRYGCFLEAQQSVELPGREGPGRTREWLNRLRGRPPMLFGELAVTGVEEGAEHLLYRLEGDGFILIRPSGTEPKLKLYFSVSARTEKKARRRLKAVRAEMLALLELTATP